MANNEELTTGKVVGLIKGLASGGGGGGGTTNYNQLSNKPQINGVTLSGNKSLSDLGITSTVVPTFTQNAQGVWSCDMTYSAVFSACAGKTCVGAKYVINNGYGEDSGFMSLTNFDGEMAYVEFSNRQLVGGHADAQSTRVRDIYYSDGNDITYEVTDLAVPKAICNTYYSSITFPVAQGTLCWHEGMLYKATTDIDEYESWNSSHWTPAYLASDLVGDVQINGTSIVSNGVADIPISASNKLGVVRVGTGLMINAGGELYIPNPQTSQIKSGEGVYTSVTIGHQHESAFYGLAKAAGADMANVSGATVGTYPAAQKAAIQSMLGVEPGVCFVETISGTTPSITAEANVRYICGEVSAISITPPQSGTTIVRFESGSTPAVLTLPNTVLFPDGMTLDTLEANTIYEIMITDGVYGGVVTWQE